jgi:hypothetical protein
MIFGTTVAQDDYLALAQQKGCTVSEANVARFQKAVAPIYAMPEYASYKEWVDKINATK